RPRPEFGAGDIGLSSSHYWPVTRCPLREATREMATLSALQLGGQFGSSRVVTICPLDNCGERARLVLMGTCRGRQQVARAQGRRRVVRRGWRVPARCLPRPPDAVLQTKGAARRHLLTAGRSHRAE